MRSDGQRLLRELHHGNKIRHWIEGQFVDMPRTGDDIGNDADRISVRGAPRDQFHADDTGGSREPE